jgi:chromosome segregation ATPase
MTGEIGKPDKQDTYSVKTTTGTKQKVEELVSKSGLSAKEFFEAMVTYYELELLKGTEAEQNQDAQQVRYHLGRVNELFIAMGQKVIDLRQDFTTRIEEEVRRSREMVAQAQQKKDQALAETDQVRAEVQAVQDRVRELEGRNRELEEINGMLKTSVDVVNKKAQEYEEKSASIPGLEQTLAEARANGARVLQQLNDEEKAHIQELSRLEKETGAERVRLQKEADEEKARLKNELAESGRQLTEIRFQLEKQGIEGERKLLEAVQKVKDECAIKVDDLVHKNQTQGERIHELELQVMKEKQK